MWLADQEEVEELNVNQVEQEILPQQLPIKVFLEELEFLLDLIWVVAAVEPLLLAEPILVIQVEMVEVQQ